MNLHVDYVSASIVAYAYDGLFSNLKTSTNLNNIDQQSYVLITEPGEGFRASRTRDVI
jgi:hypothetical protein